MKPQERCNGNRGSDGEPGSFVIESARADRITLANLSILKTGKARAVRFSTLEAICDVMQCQPGDLLEYAASSVAEETTVADHATACSAAVPLKRPLDAVPEEA